VDFGLVDFFNGVLFSLVDFFGHSPVGWAKLTALPKLYCVGLKNTNFRKLNINFYCKKWILDFELDQNIYNKFKS